MRLSSRIRKLEKRLVDDIVHMAVFTIKPCQTEDEYELTTQRLVEEYIAQGYPLPTLRVFVNEVP